MIPIDTIVSIKSGDEYGGKYTGKLGITSSMNGIHFVTGLKVCVDYWHCRLTPLRLL